MTSKNPDSLLKALLLSGTADTNIPKNFRPFINVTSSMSLSSDFNSSNIIDILLDPKQKNLSDELNRLTNEKIVQLKSYFGRIDKAKSLLSVVKILWYSTLPCFDLMGFTSRKRGEKSLLKSCIWKGREIPCEAIFSTFPTDRGVCCSFNMKAADEIFQDKRYSSLVQSLQQVSNFTEHIQIHVCPIFYIYLNYSN
jgi:hypothetical protein